MEITNIDKAVFENMILQFRNFKNRIDSLCRKYKSKELSQWIDNQDVCLMLNISPRTLQTYRDTGRISFSRINNKIYYKVSDIEELLKSYK
ncbi:helix-turn-helix domain-containing protein [Dysgonomonas sp. Marseille-P4677]|uniref:helix-turn-helix domain-containing protein n=1 Tax=Dysgonomonas sp. Marseille-P4677 TaxID=2364790 RepID=UPI001912056F|nr:helix-turn-helix domain-containing protein [Dysgonomonas sp. Marseille-P4677]MBK5722286.1 helix-turn-helix domain-containing protein [Dysgonomonas sp. Marseille-P4677]